MAKKLEELPIYHQATGFWLAISAILDRPGFGKDRRLHDQISDANDSILSNMSEGFEQPTDKALEKYLFDSKASVAEVLSRLRTAHRKGYITAEELAERTPVGEELARMLGGWIRYLARCGWKDRGRHNVKSQSPKPKGLAPEKSNPDPPESPPIRDRDSG